MLEAFKDIVPDTFAIGTHSIRSGGASAVTNSAKDATLNIFCNRVYLSVSHTCRSLVFFLFGLARGPLNMGYRWPGVFLLGASGRTGRFFPGGGYLGKFLLGMCRWHLRTPTPL